MTLEKKYGSVSAGELLFQAWPEPDPCWACGRDTQGCYVVFGLSSGELVHVCDECMADRDDGREERPGDGACV